ncbi:MAG: hypothetical protein QOG32_990, partial [Chloroflexota bacterium]|nr:hypothetical protein [Chloroflexota bacterium]
ALGRARTAMLSLHWGDDAITEDDR